MLDIKDKINSALQLHQSKNFIDAEKLYKEVLESEPENTDALNLFGLLKIQNEQFDDAILYIKKALELKPCAYFYESLGRAYFGSGNFTDAIGCYKKALEFDNHDFEIWFNLALAYKKNKQFDEAIEAYQSALTIKPNNPDVYYNLANIYENKNETPTALEYFKKAAEYNINYDNINYFLSVSYLKTKDFKKGWELYEYRPSKEFCIRTQEHHYKDLMITKPLWAGENIKDKTLFVYYEAGLGDTLMYARYIPLLKNMCAKIIFKPQFDLVTLFEDSDLDAEIIDFKCVNPEFDVHLPIMSIPYVLQQNSEEEIPFADGYLKSNPAKVEYYKQQYFNNTEFKIGIKWQGNPAYDTSRIIPLKSFYKLFDLPNVKFYSLQKDDGAEELNALPNNYEITNLGESFKDFADTAAAIENLDLVICNDTSVAHLACAMGKACWVLLPFASNWRWHMDWSYSPWYTSAKLFKQNMPENWNEVFKEVYKELISLLCLT